jgi:hypothetical protein
MIVRKISRQALANEPYLVWNAYVEILAMECYGDLDPVQRVPHLCFWYENEVQNGGHIQYFENRGTALLEETLSALRILGATQQQRVLEEAARVFLKKTRSKIQTAEEFARTALEGEFKSFDSAYYSCEPSMEKLLRAYLELHPKHFIEITE